MSVKGIAALALALGFACLSGAAPSAQAQTAAPGAGFDKLTIPLLAEGKPDKADSAVTGYLFRPQGAGPFPAVILLHGCDGLEWERPQRAGWRLLSGYAARYVAHGYAALVLDSFQPRGVANACGDPMTVSARRRAWDAYSAAADLVALGYAEKDRIVLQGESHGGWTVLVALERDRWQAPVHFAAGIAWYPSCPRVDGFLAPVLILIGDSDDWTPAVALQGHGRARECRRPRAEGGARDLPGRHPRLRLPLSRADQRSRASHEL